MSVTIKVLENMKLGKCKQSIVLDFLTLGQMTFVLPGLIRNSVLYYSLTGETRGEL